MDDDKLYERVERALAAARFEGDNEVLAAIAVIRPAVIEECAETVRRYRQRYGGNWPALENVEVEIRALAAPRVEQEGKP